MLSKLWTLCSELPIKVAGSIQILPVLQVAQKELQGIPEIAKDLLPCKCDPKIIRTVCAGGVNFANRCFLACNSAVRQRLNLTELKPVCFAPCDKCKALSLPNFQIIYHVGITPTIIQLDENPHTIENDAEEQDQRKHLTETKTLLIPDTDLNNNSRDIEHQNILGNEKDEQIQLITGSKGLNNCKCSPNITNPICAEGRNYQNSCVLDCWNAFLRSLNETELKISCFATCDTCNALENYEKARNGSKTPIKPEETVQNQFVTTEQSEFYEEEEYDGTSLAPNYGFKFSVIPAGAEIPEMIRDLVPCRCNGVSVDPLCAQELDFKHPCYFECENKVRSRYHEPPLQVTCYASCQICEILGSYSASHETVWK